MANRRMFAKTIIDSDAFLDMPPSTQAMYFHLAMRADDDGFINNPKSIMRIVGAKDDDIKLLIAKKFIIPFEWRGRYKTLAYSQLHTKRPYHRNKIHDEKNNLSSMKRTVIRLKKSDY